MISKTTRSFWKLFHPLPKIIKFQAFIAYRRWRDNPYQKGLYFKQVGQRVPIYSARINRGWRVLGLKKGNTMHWYWIGPHDEYEKMINKA